MDLFNLPAVSAPLPWQLELWSRREHQLSCDQMPHALLLSGTRHIGKERFALALARCLLCGDPVDGMNCGTCHACELSARGSHGDLRWLAPEDTSRVIKIDQVRDVVEFSTKTASFGQRKVIVLAPADTLNANAANALLKSLEEPAEDTYLILVCHRLHAVPATIRSRCQIVRLAQPTRTASLEWLDSFTGERGESERLLALGEDRPLLAASLYRDGGADLLAAQQAALVELLAGRVSAPEFAALLEVDTVEQTLDRLATGIGSLVRRLEVSQLTSSGTREIFQLLDEINVIRRAVDGGANPNRQLLLVSLLDRLQQLSTSR
jgi:DNA polymerase-3 subunit delta'